MQCLGGSPGHCTSQHRPAPALHMVSFENFVKSMPPSLSELKVLPSFCFPIKIRDDPTASNLEAINSSILLNSLFFKEKGSNKHGFDTPNRLYQIYLSHIHRPSWFPGKRFRYVSGFSKHACHQKSQKRMFSIWVTTSR